MEGVESLSQSAPTGRRIFPVRRTWTTKVQVQKYVFLLLAIVPSFGGYLLFTLYPNILSAYYSLLQWDGIGKAKFVGLYNYMILFQDKYVWRSLYHTLFFVLTVPLLVIVSSILLAYLISNKGYKGSSFFKVLFFFPNVLSTVVISLLWMFVYNGDYGLLNAFLRLLGMDIGSYYWLGETGTAIWAMIPPWVWGGVGVYLIIFINAMISIPKSLYESAILEGATHMQRLYMITIPLMMPIVRVSALFLVLGVFRSFENVLIMTNGGPSGSTEVIGLYMFNFAFGRQYPNYGYASAIGMFIFVILIIAKLTIDKYTANKAVEY